MAEKDWETTQYREAIKYLEDQKANHPDKAREVDERISELNAKINALQGKSPAREPKVEVTAEAKAKMQEDLEVGLLKKRKEELEIEELEDAAKDRDKGRAGEEERKENKGRKTKKISGGTSSHKERGNFGWILIILSIGLYVVDYITRFDGIRVDIFLQRVTLGGIDLRVPGIPFFARETLWSLLINPIIWVPVLAYFMIKARETRVISDVGSFMAWLYFPAMVLFLGGFSGISLLHIGFAVAFYYWILKDYYGEEDVVKARWTYIIFLLIDFFGYGIAKEAFLNAGYFTNRLVVPMWAILSLWFTHRMNRSKFTSAAWVVVVGFYMFMALTTMSIPFVDLTKQAGPEMREEAIEAGRTVVNNFKNWVGQLFTDIKRSAETQLEYATGGYYVGTVEENEKEQLGVYLENVEAADTNFLENEQVIVWGDLKARTLDESIYVYMSCESGDVKGNISPKVLSNPEYVGNYQKGYEVQKLEEVGFECRFNKGQLGTGTNTIKVKAEFNFKTLAFLKTYFMDIERIRALRRENVDPLAEYGIKDKTPTAVFTNGPVRLGMGTVDPPLGVYADNDAYSYVGVTVEKQWNGEIKSIKEVTIQVPKVFELDPAGDFFCRGDFKKETETEDGYAVYNMTDVALGKIKTPISQFRSWRCSMKVPKASAVLGKTPVTTFYYRAGAKYTYEIEQPINVYVKAVAGEKTMLSGCEITCTDSDGCICDADGCMTPKGNYVGKDYTCNNYLAGAASTGRTVDGDFDYIDSVEAYINAMIGLNDLCIGGRIEEIKNAIDSSADLSDEEKEQLKNDGVLTEGCGGRSYRFFEITEGLIVGKAEMGVDVFKVLGGKDLSVEQKNKANTEKTEFLGLLDRVIEHFRAINRVVITEKNEANIIKVGGEKTELESINFG